MAIGSSKDAAGKVKAARNPFTGMTLAQMKKKYSAMTPAQRKANVETFRAAAKTARKPVAKGGNKPRQTTRKEAEARFYSSSSQGSIEKNRQKAIRNFSQSSSGTRGQSLPSNPKLKSAPKRSDFPAGRGGQAKYAAAKRRYEAKPAKPSRGRLTAAQRRAARRSSR